MLVQMRGVVQDSFFGVIVLVATMAPLVAMTAAKKSNSQQLRVKPKASASGLPVPDLLESPDAKYDPKPKDIDIAALQLRLKGFFCIIIIIYLIYSLCIHSTDSVNRKFNK